MKVLINTCYGGFGFSDEFKQFYGIDDYDDWSRDNQDLIQKAEQFGLKKASGPFSKLEIVQVPDGCDYSIHEYDGTECIDETWITVTQDELKNGLSAEKLALALKVSCIRITKP
jgi:hypothetical protein